MKFPVQLRHSFIPYLDSIHRKKSFSRVQIPSSYDRASSAVCHKEKDIEHGDFVCIINMTLSKTYYETKTVCSHRVMLSKSILYKALSMDEFFLRENAYAAIKNNELHLYLHTKSL